MTPEQRQIARLKSALSYILANYTDSHLSPLGRLCESVVYDLPETGDERFDAAFAYLAPKASHKSEERLNEPLLPKAGRA